MDVKTDDEWNPATATVVSCKWRWFSGSNNPPVHSDYRVVFSYTVGSKSYRGTFIAGSPQEVGMTFPILYDPARPEENTGSDQSLTVGGRIVLWVVAVPLVIGFLWCLDRMGLSDRFNF